MNTAVSLHAVQPATADHNSMRRVFEAQGETAIRWRESTAAERIDRIKRLRDAVLAHAEQIHAAAAADFRKPGAEVDLTEIMPVVAEANHALRKVKKWMKPQGVWPTRLMMGTKSWIQHQPKGRSLIISPWNYPLNLTFSPLVSALAAGCTAILKPSEMTPHMSALMATIVRKTFAEHEVALFEGEVDVSQALLELPFDHIFFTGSPAVGKLVMAAAAKHLTSVTLELGGKSPTIVDASADIPLAASNIAWGKFTNNGQTCIAPDYVYVHESVHDAFVQELTRVLRDTYGASADAQLNSPDLARVVNARHTKRIGALLEDARSRGAGIIGGETVSEQDCFVAPALLTAVPREARIMEEEIFGPLLPILPYSNLDSVIADINAQPKPLALYMWSKTRANIDQVMQRTSSGGACINHTVVHYMHGNLPFGGVNNSGIGAAHGLFGFKAFSHERAVVKTRFMMARMFFPPYTERVRKMIRMAMKTSI
jgi:aldehyde dehydrogenase (NAD+)